jgi:hypothetical protein
MVPDEAADNLKCAGSFRVGASGSGHSETNGEALDWCLSSADCLGLGRNSLGNSDGTTVEGGMEREHVGGTWVTFCDKPLSHPSNLGQTASRWRAWKKIADPNYIPPPPPPAPAPAPAAPAAASVCPDTTGDGIVSTNDLLFVLAVWGRETAGVDDQAVAAQAADFNSDGAVNTDDLLLLLARFGQTC